MGKVTPMVEEGIPRGRCARFRSIMNIGKTSVTSRRSFREDFIRPLSRDYLAEIVYELVRSLVCVKNCDRFNQSDP